MRSNPEKVANCQVDELSRPELQVPPRKSAKGRAAEKLKATTPSMTVQEHLQTMAGTHDPRCSQRHSFRFLSFYQCMDLA